MLTAVLERVYFMSDGMFEGQTGIKNRADSPLELHLPSVEGGD